MKHLKTTQKQKVIVVTGPAGSGRTTAIKALEDFGFEAIDNLPLNLVNRLLFTPESGPALAIGVDSRTRGFSSAHVLDILDDIEQNPHYTGTLLYLDCDTDTLLRRFNETRRRHPASPDGSPRMGIEREMAEMAALRARADVLIDTANLSPHQLKAELSQWLGPKKAEPLAISVQSFSYKRGAPRSIDMMMDCRFLRNPHWEANLRPLTGLAPEVAAYVAQDPLFQPFFDKLVGLLDLLLPEYQAGGKAYFSVGMGCTGGQHRSVFVAEKLAKTLAEKGWNVSTRHKEMNRWPRGGAGK